jgi:predicted transcriptional regulator
MTNIPKHDQIARHIQQRCNALGISVTRLCREAGVSRAWFERLKGRIPTPLKYYLRISRRLDELEAGQRRAPP